MFKTVCNYLVVVFVGTVGLFRLSEHVTGGSVRTPEELAQPAAIRATPGEGVVVLTWSAPADAETGDVIGYRVVTTTASQGVVDSTGTVVRSHDVPHLVYGESYTFTVRSVGIGGAVSEAAVLHWRPARRVGSQPLPEYSSTGP